MSKAKLLSKGQITIPIEVRVELKLESGDIVVLQTSNHQDVRITKGNKNEHNFNSKAVVTTKGQITIPKEIMIERKLEKGDNLLFSYLNGFIYFRKQGEMIPCPVCNGIGSFEDFELPCFICDQSSYIEKHEKGILFLLFFQNKFRKYKVSNMVIQQEIDDNGIFSYRQFPKLLLKSTEYPEELLNKIQDTLQILLLEEHLPKSNDDSSKIMIPSDDKLKDILDLFITEEAKKTVKDWFKFNRTI